MRDVETDDEFLTRVATFIEAVDLHPLRVEWGDDTFERITAYAWTSIPHVVKRLSILGDREMLHSSRRRRPGALPRQVQ